MFEKWVIEDFRKNQKIPELFSSLVKTFPEKNQLVGRDQSYREYVFSQIARAMDIAKERYVNVI